MGRCASCPDEPRQTDPDTSAPFSPARNPRCSPRAPFSTRGVIKVAARRLFRKLTNGVCDRAELPHTGTGWRPHQEGSSLAPSRCRSAPAPAGPRKEGGPGNFPRASSQVASEFLKELSRASRSHTSCSLPPLHKVRLPSAGSSCLFLMEMPQI